MLCKRRNRRPTTIAPVVAALACLGLAACGSSSSESSSSASTPTAAKTTAEATTTTPASTTPTSSTPTTPTSTTSEPTITTRAQFVAVFECLRHNGIKLPPLKELGGKNKINTNTPQFKAARTKCLHAVLGANATTEATPTTPTTTTPTSTTPEISRARRRQLAASVAKCLRSNGAQVAEPNAEGFLKIEGPASRTPQFHAAVTKCHSVIAEAFAGASSKK
jgi:hypothetical protein